MFPRQAPLPQRRGKAPSPTSSRRGRRERPREDGAEAAPVEAPPRDDRVTTITPATRLPKLDLRELWRYRELALTFVWRDLKVRYKQTLHRNRSGWCSSRCWRRCIFTLIFGRFAEFPSDDVPYPIFVFAGVIMWTTYFQPAFNSASGSIAGSKSLITEGVLPARPAPARGRGDSARRLRHRLPDPRGDDLLVRHRPQLRRLCCSRSSCCWRWSPPSRSG